MNNGRSLGIATKGSMSIETLARRVVRLTCVGIVLGWGGQALAAAKAKPIACATSITTCGCQIQKKGIYTVNANLDYTQGLTPDGNCVEITASNVTLNLNDFYVYGPGVVAGSTATGIGIDILKGSNDDVIIAGSPTGIRDISFWNVGISDSGKSATISNVDTDSNELAGILLDGASDTQIAGFDASFETNYGVWIQKGNNNFVSTGLTQGDGVGVLVGCGTTATGQGQDCKGVKKVKNNIITNNTAYQSAIYGIAADSNAVDTVVVSNNMSAGNGPTSEDLFDASTTCGSTLYLGNAYTTSLAGTTASDPCFAQ